MPNGVFNNIKGRPVELYKRIEGNDPTNSEWLIVLGLGAITDGQLEDIVDLAELEADAGFAESVDGSYGRKSVHPGSSPVLPADPGPDNTNNRYDLPMPDQTWNGMNGETLTRLIVCYEPNSAASADANILCTTFHDFSVTTDGSDLTAQFDAQGFFSAS